MKLNGINNGPSFGMAWNLNKKSLVGADRAELDLLKNFLDKNGDEIAKRTEGYLTTIYANVKNGEIDTLSLRTLPRADESLLSYTRDKFKAIKDSIALIRLKKQPEYESFNIPFKKVLQGHYNLLQDVSQTVEASASRFADKDRVMKYLGESLVHGRTSKIEN